MRRSLWLLCLALGCGGDRLVGVGNVDEPRAAEPPDLICATDHPCRLAAFDRQVGRCVEQEVAAGTSCNGGHCLSGAACFGGECTGGPISCDDGDPCTQDACNSDYGCTDLGPASACPVPEMPCMVRTCDPESGCGQAAAPDGSACVDGDDRAAGKCNDGRCEPAIPPEACYSACWAGCWPGSVTSPVWSYRPATPEIDLQFPAIADAEGNLYWREHSGDGCVLVSMGIDGTGRFRTMAPCAGKARMALLRGRTVLFLESDRVIAHDSRDGGLAWIFEARAPEGCGRYAAAMAASGDSLFVVWLETCSDPNRTIDKHVLSGVGLATGAMRFEYSAGRFGWDIGSSSTVVSDLKGNVYARFGDGPHGQVLLSLAADGALRWQKQDVVRSWPVATIADRAYLFWYSGLDYWGAAVVRGTDGELLPSLGRAISGWTIFGDPMQIGAGFVIEPGGRIWSTTGRGLAIYDGAGGGVGWSHDGCSLGVCHPSNSPILTGSGTVLLAGSSPPANDIVIAEVDGDGRVKRTCSLESSNWTEGPFVLHDGIFVAPLIEERRVVGLAAWWLPGLTEAESGWTSPGGGPARGGAPH